MLCPMFITWISVSWIAACWAVPPTVGSAVCRSRDGMLLDVVDFNAHACRLCYHYLHISHFNNGMKLTTMMLANISLISDVTQPKYDVIVKSFIDSAAETKWRECCAAARRCCDTMSDQNDANMFVPGWCPRTWDGWQCWRDTPPGSTQHQPCPSYSYSLNVATVNRCSQTAAKVCGGTGEWYKNRLAREWTNYTTCNGGSAGNVAELRLREWVSVTAYCVSIVTIIPALVIFQAFRQLHGHRIILHKNLLVSLLCNALTVIAFKTLVVLTEFNYNLSYISQNHAWCKMLLMSTKYFRLSTYMWMFCESYYLHRLLTSTFASENSILLFYVIGWGIPVIPEVIYGVLRSIFHDSDCWAIPATKYYIEWLLYIPCLLSLAVNALFLINILSVLMKKLKEGNNVTSQYRKAVKATLFLVPLFGLQMLLTLYRPPRGCDDALWRHVYMTTDRLLDGLQGAVVAVLYCYTNNEVHVILSRSLRNIFTTINPSRSAVCTVTHVTSVGGPTIL